MKKSLLFALFTILAITAFSQSPAPAEASPVKWYTVQDVEKLTKQEARPVFIDTYTDWCGWCKKMDRETFTNPVISDILNKKYYAVKFDAEGKENVSFLGQTYVNDGKSGNAHQLAIALLRGQLSYPTVVFLVPQPDGKFQLQAVPGFREAKDMEAILSYFADNKVYGKQSFEDYQKSFQGKVK